MPNHPRLQNHHSAMGKRRVGTVFSAHRFREECVCLWDGGHEEPCPPYGKTKQQNLSKKPAQKFHSRSNHAKGVAKSVAAPLDSGSGALPE